MTPIPGTNELKSIKTQEVVNENVQQSTNSKIVGIYKKKTPINDKFTTESKLWYLDRKYWVRTSVGISLVSIALGFLIYRSFFILALFAPIGVMGVWYFVKLAEDHVSKFDSFSK